MRDKRVVLEEFPIRNLGVMQAFAFNIRRDKFKDPRVRRAFNFAFDFEEMNKQIFFGQYKRIASYFDGTELASSGLPEGKELEILQTVHDKVPPELVHQALHQSGRRQIRRRCATICARRSRCCARPATRSATPSWSTPRPASRCRVEFLIEDPAFERVVLFYKPSLERLGMTVNVRTVDTSQYENRLRQWDYDIIVASWGESLSPGNEQRGFWSSQAADQPGSRNLIGIKNPAVDALIERVIFAKDRDELVAATKALDRVLLWNFYVVPQWTYGTCASARWDRFSRPADHAEIRSVGVPDDLVVGRGQGGQGAAAVLITRRHALVLSAGALAAAKFASPRRRARRRAARHVGLRRSRNIRRIFRISTTSIRTRPRAACSRRSAPNRSFNQLVPHLQFAQQLHPQGRRARRAWTHLRDADGALGRRARRHVWAGRASVRISADGLTYRFTLRPEAKFHDGTPLTAHDVAFSLTTLKEKGHPIITQLLRDFKGAEATDDRTVVVRFADKRARDVPLFVAGLPIFSRAYYAKQPFDQSTLEIPLGSGAYKVGRFEAGHFIEYERVKDWWGADLPVSRGQNNFDIVRFEYYRDRDVGFEGFTAKNYLFREEFTSRIWATRYDFPAFKDGRVKRAVLPDDTPSGAQGWFINTRRKKFKDRRLREALIDAFDFEWTNKNIMYGSYERTQSVFQNSPMMAKGKPDAAELALLEPFRGKVPDEVFGEPYVPPVTDGSGQDRRCCGTARNCSRTPASRSRTASACCPTARRSPSSS